MKEIFGSVVVSWVLYEPRHFDDSYTIQTEKYFLYIYVLCFSSVKVNLMVLFFPRLNLSNLSLLPEDYNGSQRQRF